MADYLSSALGPPASRHLNHSRRVPFSPNTAFRAVSEIASYSIVLPYTISSTVTAKDGAGLPKACKIKIGYPSLGIEEEWICQVKCDKATGTLEMKYARAAATNQNAGTFEQWTMKWRIEPSPTGASSAKTATMHLHLDIKFRSAMYDQMFSFLPQVAEKIVDSFEGRVVTLDEEERKERLRKIREKSQAEAAKKKAKGNEAAVPSSATKRAPKKLEVRSAPK